MSMCMSEAYMWLFVLFARLALLCHAASMRPYAWYDHHARRKTLQLVDGDASPPTGGVICVLDWVRAWHLLERY
jgi:hypothetical protein